jgi:hypothetical protein
MRELNLPEQYLKAAAPSSFVSATQEIEKRADECHQRLVAFRLPQNLATWAVLTRIAERIEREIADRGYGSPAHIAVMLNLSRAASQVLEWVQQSGDKSFVPRRAFKWGEPALVAAADQALFTSLSYGAFTSNFPLWHKNFLHAELIPPSSVRFLSTGDGNELRVRAYQQGLRPSSSRPSQGSSLRFGAAEQTVKQKLLNLVQNGSRLEGPLSFSYGKPKRLWEMIYAAQIEAMNSLFRRSEALDVGGYDLGEFKRFYAGFLAICATHENACDLRGQMQQKYPLDSAVLVKRRSQWIEILGEITSLEHDKMARMIGDLTFGATVEQDVYVHPFIPLSEDGEELGVVPHFALNSRADENVIRVCSRLRPAFHGAISRAKEDEMRAELVAYSRPGLSLRGPRLLPSPLPDIDLVIEDIESSCVVIAELKWLRKTVRPGEHPARQKEFLDGIMQLEKIKAFLRENSTFLHDRGDISQDLKNVQHLHYVLIARDYFVWVDPAQGYPVLDYEPFLAAMKAGAPLAKQVRDLLEFEWLPVEGRDFRASYSRQTVAGVSIESQIIHASY